MVSKAAVCVVERWQLALPLGKCSGCHRAFTCYPPGIYPRRQYLRLSITYQSGMADDQGWCEV